MESGLTHPHLFLHPFFQLKGKATDLCAELKYAVGDLISFLLIAVSCQFSALLLVDHVTLQDFILDSKFCKYCHSKLSKSLGDNGNLLSPPVVLIKKVNPPKVNFYLKNCEVR